MYIHKIKLYGYYHYSSLFCCLFTFLFCFFGAGGGGGGGGLGTLRASCWAQSFGMVIVRSDLRV